MDSLQGHLLVSSPALVDPNFRRTVVLIAHHDEDGAMGLVLTRPSEVKVADAVPALEPVAESDAVVSVGGPVQPEAFMPFIAERSQPVGFASRRPRIPIQIVGTPAAQVTFASTMSGRSTRSTCSRCGTKPSTSIDHVSSPGCPATSLKTYGPS